MNKKRLIITLCGTIAVAAVLVTGGWFLYQRYQAREAARLAQEAYDASHVTIDGVDYETSLTELDLSGKPLTEWRGLSRISGLKKLDLRDTGITAEVYDSIRSLLPACSITWSVPFQGEYLSENTSVLTVSTLTSEDVQAMRYLPRLSQVNADGCTDYELLLHLKDLYPNVNVSYQVELGGTDYPNTTRELTLENPDLEELERMVPYLPELEYVALTGALPQPEVLAQLQDRLPDVALDWVITAFDREFSSLDTFIDLSRISMKDTEEVERIIPLFRDLEQIDMLQCGLSNQTMDALNKRWPDTKVVWQVYLCGTAYRTDAKYYMPVKYGVGTFSSAAIADLRYCSDMLVVDLGHYGVNDVSFVEYMPNLTYLLVCQTAITDMTPIGNCKNLKCLELFGTNCDDLWPLVNLTNLENLNIADAPCVERRGIDYARYEVFSDVTPLYRMTWLDRLWMSNTRLGREGRNALREALPDTDQIFFAYSATSAGWRHTPSYYDMRDIVEMIYFVH